MPALEALISQNIPAGLVHHHHLIRRATHPIIITFNGILALAYCFSLLISAMIDRCNGLIRILHASSFRSLFNCLAIRASSCLKILKY